MRFLHTADWHLGRTLHGVSLLEDQAHVLEQLVGIVRAERPDFVLVAGDVYDRPVPPAEAVRLLNDVLCELVLGARVPVLLIPGNHDCPQRLGFAGRLLRAQHLHVVGPLLGLGPVEARYDRPVALPAPPVGGGPAAEIFLVPYADPPLWRAFLDDPAVQGHDSALRAALARLPAPPAAATSPSLPPRRLLVAHAFVAGGTGSESERPLSVGGTGAVDAARFAGFGYVALGHLHRAQNVAFPGGGPDPDLDPETGRSAPLIRYAGSPLKYSFSEADDQKSVTLVDWPAGAPAPAWRTVPLTPRRELRLWQGHFSQLLAAAPDHPQRRDYLSVELLDPQMVFDAVARLREHCPHLLHLTRRALRPSPACAGAGAREHAPRPGAEAAAAAAAGGGEYPAAHAGTELEERFAQFFREVADDELSDALRAGLREALAGAAAGGPGGGFGS